MRRIARASMLFTAALFAAASPAAAVTGGPAIAYALNVGNTFDVYLSNADGSGKVKLYSTANKVNVFEIDMRPGGNQLAILEGSSVANSTLKIIGYTDTGVRTSLTTVSSPGCVIQGVDYHPSNGSLIASRYCNGQTVLEVRIYDPSNNGWASDALVSLSSTNPDKAINGVRWLGDGSGFLWAIGDTASGHGRIDRHMLSNPYAPVTVYQNPGLDVPVWFDVARCAGALDSGCSKLLVTYGINIHLVTFDDFGGTDQGAIYSNAADGHFSPDNAHVLWRQQVRSGYNLMIDGTSLLSKGGFGGKDWRQ